MAAEFAAELDLHSRRSVGPGGAFISADAATLQEHVLACVTSD